MKRIIIILICCLAFVGVQAQKITREYNNVPLNDALHQLFSHRHLSHRQFQGKGEKGG